MAGARRGAAARSGLDALRHLPPLSGLSPKDVAPLADLARRQTYARDDYLWVSADPSGYAYFIDVGKAQLLRWGQNGRAAALELLVAGDLFGLVLSDREPVESTARILVDGTVIWSLPRKPVLDLISTHLSVAKHAFAQFWRRLEHVYERVEDLSCYPVKIRLARTLIRLGTDEERTISATQEELAAWIGASREGVGRALQQFQASHMIAYHPRRGVKILDPAGLAKK